MVIVVMGVIPDPEFAYFDPPRARCAPVDHPSLTLLTLFGDVSALVGLKTRVEMRTRCSKDCAAQETRWNADQAGATSLELAT
jgi:hypothetical protein